ncbi:MAG: hypothetical protein JWM53_2847 [bacterium]|nr:hypothetical protein [bacterium]
MGQAAAAALMVAAILSCSATARGQPALIGMQDDLQDAVPDAEPPPPSCCCCCRFVPKPGEPTETELTAVIVAGATGAALSQFLALVFIANQPHSLPAVDTIPVIGTIFAAQRNVLDARTMPLLLFSAGVQAIGILVAGVAGAELAAQRRLLVDLAASPAGAGVGITWRY